MRTVGMPAADAARLPNNHEHYVGSKPNGALLPMLPPHASSPRSQPTTTMAMYTLAAPEDVAAGGWQPCLGGGNKLPLPIRLKAASAQPKLGSFTACARQLTADLSTLVSAELPIKQGVTAICGIVKSAVEAEAVALMPASMLGFEMCLSEHTFDKACQHTLAAAGPCERLLRSLPHELRHAAENRSSLNIGGQPNDKIVPEAVEVSQVVVRDPDSAILKLRVPPLESALIMPVPDPHTGATVALLVCANTPSGRFQVHDELFSEAAALHIGLMWLTHIQSLRLVPLPGAPLAPPDQAADGLKTQWAALADSRANHRRRRDEAVRALERAGGGPEGKEGKDARPIDAICKGCKQLLLTRAVELRHTMLAAASQLPRSGRHQTLGKMALQWSASLVLEVQSEAECLGGSFAGAAAAKALGETVQHAAEEAGRLIASAPGFGAPSGAVVSAEKSRAAAATEEAKDATAEDSDADADLSFSDALLLELERRVVQPTLRRALPILQRLPALNVVRAAQLRAELAELITSDDEELQKMTSDLIRADMPALLGDYTASRNAECVPPVLTPCHVGSSLVSCSALLPPCAHRPALPRESRSFVKEIRLEAGKVAGEVAAAAASEALSDLVHAHGSVLRVGILNELHGAAMLMTSALEKHMYEIVGWVEAALKGRLAYRDTLVSACRVAFPKILRHLLGGLLRAAPPAAAAFEQREAAISNVNVDPARPPPAGWGFGGKLPPPPPGYASVPLANAVAAAVDAFLDATTKALEPLGKQYGTVVAQTRPRVIKKRGPLREDLLHMLSVCARHGRYVVLAHTAINRMADGMEEGVLALEPQLLPLLGGAPAQPIDPTQLSTTVRTAVKLAVLSEASSLVSELAYLLDTHEFNQTRLEECLQASMKQWSDKCYTGLLTSLTDIGGESALADTAAPYLAKMCPAAAQRMVRDLHREGRLMHFERRAREAKVLESEAEVMRCMARPETPKHAAAIAKKVVVQLGAQLRPSLDEIVDAVEKGKYAQEYAGLAPKPAPPPPGGRKLSLSSVSAEDTEALADAHAKASAIAKAAGGMVRFQLRELIAQVFAMPVVSVLERAIVEVVERAEWLWPESIGPSYSQCIRRWLGAVRERVGRAFLPMANGDEESRILSFTQTTCTLAQTTLNDMDFARAVDGPPIQDDLVDTVCGLLVPSIARELRGVGKELKLSAALGVLLHLDPGPLPQPSPLEAVALGPLPATAHRWALARSRHLCLVDGTLAALDASSATLPDDLMADALNRLVIEGDPSTAAPKTDNGPVDVEEANGKGVSTADWLLGPPKALAHLARTFWLLLDHEMDVPQLLQTLADALPDALGDRRVDGTLYVPMAHAPAEHRATELGGACVDDELIFMMSVGTADVDEERVVRVLTVPAGVRMALSEGARTEEMLEEITSPRMLLEAAAPSAAGANGDATPGAEGLISSQRIFLPVRRSADSKPLAVVELGLEYALLASERENLVRLVSAFGGAANRCTLAATSKVALGRASADLAVQANARARHEAEAARQAALLHAGTSLLPLTQRPTDSGPAGVTALGAALKDVTKARFVTIFAVPHGFASRPDLPLEVVHNADFKMYKADLVKKGEAAAAKGTASGGQRGSSSAARKAMPPPETSDLLGISWPHHGLARRAAVTKAAYAVTTNLLDAGQEPPDVYDRSHEGALGFSSGCCLLLPVVHRGELIGVIQCTNKQAGFDGHDDDDDAGDAPEPNIQTLLFGAESPDDDDDEESDVDAAEEAVDVSSNEEAPPPPPSPRFSAGEEAGAQRLLGLAALLLLPARGEGAKLPPPAAPKADDADKAHGKDRSPRSRRPLLGRSKDRTPAAPPLTTLPNALGVIEAITAITRELSTAYTLRALLTAALQGASRLVPAQHAAIFVTGEDDGSMVRVAQPHDELGKAILTELDVTRIADAKLGIVGRVLAKNEPTSVAEVSRDPDFNRTVDCAPGYVVNSCAVAPICGSGGRVLAAVFLCNKVGGPPPKAGAAASAQSPMTTAAEFHKPEFDALDMSALVMFSQLVAPPLERQLLREGFFMGV